MFDENDGCDTTGTSGSGEGPDRYEKEFEDAPEGFEEVTDDEFFDGSGDLE